MKAVVISILLSIAIFAQSDGNIHYEKQINGGVSVACSDFRIGGILEINQSNGIGWYILFRIGTGGTDNNYYDNISYEKAKYEYKDKELERTNKLRDYGIGLNYSVEDIITFGAGLLITSSDEFAKFYDKYQILGDNGNYYVSAGSLTSFSYHIYVAKDYKSKFRIQIGISDFNKPTLELGILWNLNDIGSLYN